MISIKNTQDPLIQMQNTRFAIGHRLKSELEQMKGIKFVETLKVTFVKQKENHYIFQTAYFNCQPQTIINDNEIAESLQLTQQRILNTIAQWLSEGSGWLVERVESHHLNIVKYDPMSESSCIKLPEELQNSSKGFINLKNEDNECFCWCHIIYLNPQQKDPQRIKKSYKEYINRLDYSGIDFPMSSKHYKWGPKQYQC